MLTREVYSQTKRGVPAPEGGRRIPDDREWAAVFNRGGNYLGDRLAESGSAFESLSVLTEKGELLEVITTDEEIVVGVNDTICAAYDRVGGFLVSASFSLVGGVIDAYSREMLDLPEALFERAVELKKQGDDLVVVVEFDDDGEAKLFLVRTESSRVAQLIKVISHDEMHESYGNSEAEDDEDDLPSDIVVEGEEELVGELLSAWLAYCPVLDLPATYSVGIRSEVVDFCLLDVDNEEALPYHVSNLIDPSRLDDQRLSRKLIERFVAEAFPEMDWV